MADHIVRTGHTVVDCSRAEVAVLINRVEEVLNAIVTYTAGSEVDASGALGEGAVVTSVVGGRVDEVVKEGVTVNT